MNEDRLKHSISVGRKMIELGKKYNLHDEELKELFLLGYNHDIGYEFVEDGFNHNVIGGEILKEIGFKHWKEVYYHGEPNAEYKSFYLKLLNEADMQIDKYGNDVGFEERLKDIKNRYGVNSMQYQKSKQIVDKIKKEEL